MSEARTSPTLPATNRDGAMPIATIHEEISGGLGRGVYYRAQRMLVRNFLRQQEARIVIEEREEYPVHDLSMNGMSFFAPSEAKHFQPGAVVNIAVAVQDKATLRNRSSDTGLRDVIFRGQARIARADETPSALHIGVQLVDGFLNLPQVQWNYAERMLRRDLEGGPSAIRDRVPPAYREAVEHAAFFIQFYKQSLTDHEHRYAQMGDEGKEAIRARTPKAALESLRGPWHAISEQASRTIIPHMHDPTVLRAAKRYTETAITPLVITSPFVERSYLKPLGYAGDYESMLQIYRDGFEGASVFDRVFHKLCCEHPMSRGVRSRKDFVRELHHTEYARQAMETPNMGVFRVTNVGSGPAREVGEFADTQRDWPVGVHWTLIDGEEEALSLAYHELYPKLANRQPPRTLRCMYMSFVQFISDPPSTLTSEPQHLIYSVGLLDYVQEPRARAIVEALYERLAPGGLLAIANALWPNTHLWFCEFALDWSLIYRTEADMLRLANTLPENTEKQVVAEPSNAFHFLLVRKP